MVIRAGDGFTDEPAEIVELAKQDVVVDVQPASRHGGPADIAHIRSTVVTASGQVVTTTSTLPVFANADGFFAATVSVPPAFGRLGAGKEFTVMVLLPRAGDDYDVELREYSGDYDPQVFDDEQNPKLGGRIAVVWRGNGTDLGWVWNYVPAK